MDHSATAKRQYLDGDLGALAAQYLSPAPSVLRRLTPGEQAAKRAIDVLGATVLLALTLPLLLVVAALIALTSRGPIFYSQVRTGLNRRGRGRDRRLVDAGPPPGLPDRRVPGRPDRRAGRAFGTPFRMYKLRTMVIDAERDGPRLAEARDPRVTRIGRFLRRTRIDELPQLWNVLRGEMSLVGPRPERPEFIGTLSKEIPDYLHRLGIKPGLTGLAQVVNGYDSDLDSVRRKVQLDLEYLRGWSLFGDLALLVRTVSVVLRSHGAR